MKYQGGNHNHIGVKKKTKCPQKKLVHRIFLLKLEGFPKLTQTILFSREKSHLEKSHTRTYRRILHLKGWFDVHVLSTMGECYNYSIQKQLLTTEINFDIDTSCQSTPICNLDIELKQVFASLWLFK